MMVCNCIQLCVIYPGKAEEEKECEIEDESQEKPNP